MAQRITNSTILSSNQSSNGITFKDMLLDLKPDPKTGKTTKKIRLIGEPILYMEYNPRIRDYDNLKDGKPTLKPTPFPDAHLRKAVTRIGHDDPEQCDWAKRGYIGSRKYAQNCLERMPDGTFAVKVLNKGAQVFKPLAEWENNKVVEREEGEEVDCTFLGGRWAYEVNVTCVKDDSAPGGVKYSASPRSKLVEITDEEIEALRAVHEPSPEELKALRKEYNERRKVDPRLPEFEDFYEFGFDLRNIFKYTPLLTEEDLKKTQNSNSDDDEDEEDEKPKAPKAKAVSKQVSVDDEEEEEDEPKETPKAKSATKTAKKNIFEDSDDAEDDDDWSAGV